MKNIFAKLELRVMALFTGPVTLEPDPLSMAIDQIMAADVFFNEAQVPTQIDISIAMRNHAQALLTEQVQAAKIKQGIPLNTERVGGSQ